MVSRIWGGTCGGTRVMQALRRKPSPARRVEFRELGKASDMKKAVLGLATAATIGITALVTPSPAQAWRSNGGGGPRGGPIAGSIVIDGIVVGAPARGPGYCFYLAPGDGYHVGPYYGPWYYGPRCYMGVQFGR